MACRKPAPVASLAVAPRASVASPIRPSMAATTGNGISNLLSGLVSIYAVTIDRKQNRRDPGRLRIK
jgi:hypothetical protein